MARTIKDMYRDFLLAVIFFAVFVCDANAVDGETRIVIVDENGEAFTAETVRWWYSGRRNNKVELECVNGRCDERLLKRSEPGAIIVAADTTVVEPEDGSCWKLYHGEVLFDSPAQEIKIVMQYKNKICR